MAAPAEGKGILRFADIGWFDGGTTEGMKGTGSRNHEIRETHEKEQKR